MRDIYCRRQHLPRRRTKSHRVLTAYVPAEVRRRTILPHIFMPHAALPAASRIYQCTGRGNTVPDEIQQAALPSPAKRRCLASFFSGLWASARITTVPAREVHAANARADPHGRCRQPCRAARLRRPDNASLERRGAAGCARAPDCGRARWRNGARR